ncbi:MAG: hypothetical protein LBL91_02100 [Lachnospiraceae bacterium]|jgi:Gpi18-like mannosyltransferase|nr:hypothetical protein [Lachnospiraceae bacterium]
MKKVWDLIDKYKMQIFFVIFALLAVIIRVFFLESQSGDYNTYLKPWFDKLLADKGLLGIANYDGNYNMPYVIILAILTYLPIDSLISIKVVSIFFDFVCATFGALIVREIITDKNKTLFSFLIFISILFLPTVVLNSAGWAQSDSIYAAFMLISLFFLVKEKYIKSFIFLGIAFAFKLQFIFILPVYILVYISKRNFPIWYFLFIPITEFIMCLPSILLGAPINSFITVYTDQASEYVDYVVLNLPNIHTLLFYNDSLLVVSPAEYIPKTSTLITIVIFIISAFIILYKKVKLNKVRIIEFALWSILVSCFFLPHMHERYLYAADIISIIYFAITKKNIYIPLSVNLISFISYANYLYGAVPIPFSYVAIFYLAIIIKFTKDIFKPIFVEKVKENKTVNI